MSNNECDDRVGVILLNTGTPDSPKPEDIKPYLAQFLSDKHVVRVPHALWLPILHCFILPTRPNKTRAKYEQIWTPEGSPFMIENQRLAEGVQRTLSANAPGKFSVVSAMRYGKPSPESAFCALEQKGCTRIIAIPLFPQTAYCTTESCTEALWEAARRHPNVTLSIIEGYAGHPAYIRALANSVRKSWRHARGERLLFTFHSIPVSDIAAGDTYAEQARQTANLVAQELNLGQGEWDVAFQSRFKDSRKWLGPATHNVLSSWAKEGVRRVDVIAPGFSVDCLETLFDCAIEQKRFFESLCDDERSASAEVARLNGSGSGSGGCYTYIPALNSQNEHISLLAELIEGIL